LQHEKGGFLTALPTLKSGGATGGAFVVPKIFPHQVISGIECKRCSICKKYLPLNCFNKNKGTRDGLRYICKKCIKIETSEQREFRLQSRQLYREKNREKRRQDARNYYQVNRNKIRAAYRKSHNTCKIVSIVDKKHKDNPAEYLKAYRKLYNASERGRSARQVTNGRYKQRKNGLTATLNKHQWQKCKEHFKNECAYCGRHLEILTQDHFIPVANNGEYTHNNIIPSCKRCNSSKHDRDFFDWYPQQPFYDKRRERRILKYLGYNKGIKAQQPTLF
jgi:hypothetical protein